MRGRPITFKFFWQSVQNGFAFVLSYSIPEQQPKDKKKQPNPWLAEEPGTASSHVPSIFFPACPFFYISFSGTRSMVLLKRMTERSKLYFWAALFLYFLFLFRFFTFLGSLVFPTFGQFFFPFIYFFLLSWHYLLAIWAYFYLPECWYH